MALDVSDKRLSCNSVATTGALRLLSSASSSRMVKTRHVLSFITSILLALVEEEGRQIQEERRLLGLDPRARQIEIPFSHPSEWIVPVSLCADSAGIYRIIGLPAFWLAEEQIGGR